MFIKQLVTNVKVCQHTGMCDVIFTMYSYKFFTIHLYLLPVHLMVDLKLVLSFLMLQVKKVNS